MATVPACNHKKRQPAQAGFVPKYQDVTAPDSESPQLDARDLRIAQLIFDGELSTDAIGREVGLSGAMIRMIRAGSRIPAIAQFIETLCREAVEQDRVAMLRSQRRAGQVLAELLESTDARVRLDAARAIRAELKGFKLSVETQTVTPADASRMFAERFHGSGSSAGGRVNGDVG
jgi:hypothetical protein